MNILLMLAFDGGAYAGFQVQKNAPTVCAAVQDAMQALFGARPDVKGCSRTDAGVHARQFCLSFRQQTAIPMGKLPLALNAHLPADIRACAAQAVPEDFHARYSATGKEYRYIILNTAVDDPFAAGHYHRVPGPLDAEAMNAAGRALLGRRDFASFQAAGAKPGGTVRNVTGLSVTREGDWVTLAVAADGFLYHMVRIMAGTLLAVGTGRLPAEALPGILEGRSRALAGDTLPAKGLFLHRVFYPKNLSLRANANLPT